MAYRRHFPAINWLNSYSLYKDRMSGWFSENIASDWNEITGEALRILQVESELEEIVKLVGMDALSASDRLTLEVARSVREDFLQQNAFNIDDSYSPLDKQYKLLKAILAYFEKSKKAVEQGADIEKLSNIPARETIGRMKSVPLENFDGELSALLKALDEQIDGVLHSEED